MLIQIRKNGEVWETESLEEATHELLANEADKISWNGPARFSRFIIRSDGTWEYKTPEDYSR